MPHVTIRACSPNWRYPKFVDPDGVLRCGDAEGFEAAWCLDQITVSETLYPEDEWSLSQIQEDERGVGCVRCGAEEVDTTRGLCRECS